MDFYLLVTKCNLRRALVESDHPGQAARTRKDGICFSESLTLSLVASEDKMSSIDARIIKDVLQD